MGMLPRFARCVLCAAMILGPSALARANVLIVDANGAPGTFTTLQAACDAAAEGDTVLIKSGTYAGFAVADKALTVATDSNAYVQIYGAVRVRNLAAGKTAVLIGLKANGVYGSN